MHTFHFHKPFSLSPTQRQLLSIEFKTPSSPLSKFPLLPVHTGTFLEGYSPILARSMTAGSHPSFLIPGAGESALPLTKAQSTHLLKHFLRVLPISTVALGIKAPGRGTHHSKHSSQQTVDSIILLYTKISENFWAGLESITAKTSWNLSLSVWKNVF